MLMNESSASSNNDMPMIEIEITYTEQEIAEKLKHYQIDSNWLFLHFKSNINQLESAILNSATADNATLQNLKKALNNWPAQLNLPSFTAHINQLIFWWLSAIQQHVALQTILNLTRCVSSKSLFSNTITAKLHLFMFSLVADSVQQYQLNQLNYAINFDANTQLPHANQIVGYLTEISNNSAPNQVTALVSIQFQIAKNMLTFSHIASSKLSQKITVLLKQNIATDYVLFYAGNLKFDLLIPHLNNDLTLNLLAAKLGRAFEEILLFDHESVLVTPFSGAAIMQCGMVDYASLCANAKSALESALAKQQYFVQYSPAIKLELALQTELEKKVLDAFATDSLTLFFQPIVDIEQSTCVGAELLLRWSTEAGDHIYPSVTIEILNKVGKGKLFTRWLINSACRYASELINDYQLPIYLTINLRAEDLYDIELPHLLSQAMALWKISPQNIVLEITENGILEYNESSRSVIKTLSESGFRLALDDFGTGFSSLSRLRTMPIDLIKIDQSFVRDIKHSRLDFNIVSSIATLAYTLGKEVLAEGVEDEDCLELIKRMKIHKCQGYYFAKPMPFEAFLIWAKQHQAA